MKTKRIILLTFIILITLLLTFLIYWKFFKERKDPKPNEPVTLNSTFDYNMIHMANKNNDNYMISPFSIAYALSILNEGAKGNTKTQIDKVLGNYKLNKVTNTENRIGLSNALFIKNENKNDIRETYTNKIKNNFDADILYDDFITPKVINDYAKEKTFGMIDNVLDNIDKDFVMGIMNAIAIDVEWKYKFDGYSTYKEKFTNLDNTTNEVDMMHSSNDITYIENENAKGIIKEYNKYGDNELIFIGIIPNNNIKEYINKFDKNELDSLLSNKKEPSSKLDINLSLPKFKYNFDYKDFKKDLKEMGITDAFDENIADFHNIINDNTNYNLYVSEAIHKSVIELNENGTKAAAITYFGMSKNSMMPKEKEVINIKFNKPFLYIIKDKNNDNIWFFGTVYNLSK